MERKEENRSGFVLEVLWVGFGSGLEIADFERKFGDSFNAFLRFFFCGRIFKMGNF